MGKRGDASELEFSTLSIAVTGVKYGIDVLSRVIEDASSDIIGDMVEPLETYYKNYSDDSQESIQKSLQIWNQYQDATHQQTDARDKFYNLKEQAIE